MTSTNEYVARLSSDRVDSLLAIGLMPPADRAVCTILDLLLEGDEADRSKLMGALLRDLQSPLRNPDGGPLSFLKLKPEAATGPIPGRQPTIWEASTSPATGRDLLEALSDYGDVLAGEAFLPASRVFGGVVRALSLAALARDHGVLPTPDTADAASALLDVVSQTPELPDWFVEPIARARDAFDAP